MLNKTDIIRLAGILLTSSCTLILSCNTVDNRSHEKPNVIFILADDLGYGDLQCYGNPYLNTPSIDKLAKEGVLLTRYYSPSPLCAPSRAAILTGMYNHRTGAVDVSSNRGIDRIALSYKTMGDYFKEAGYSTGLIGKWHNGLYDNQYHPNNRGFDHYFGFLNGIQDYWKWNLDLNGTNVPADGRYLTDVITTDAIDFIEKNQAEPFFLFVAHHAPHVPLQAPDSLVQKYLHIGKDSLNKEVATIYAMIEVMDRGVGDIIDKVRDLGLTDNTIIVFTSDNGANLKGKENRFHYNLSGNKDMVLEEGIRVPAIVSWPGVIPPGKVVDELVHGCDWLPTLFGLTGDSLRSDKKIDGLNIMPLLKGEALPALAIRKLFFQKNRYYPYAHSDAAMIMGKWKLYWPGIPATIKKEKIDNEPVWYGATHPHKEMPIDTIIPTWENVVSVNRPQLFDLANDSAESNDLAAEQPAIVKQMAESWDNWFHDVMIDYEISWKDIKRTEFKKWSKTESHHELH